MKLKKWKKYITLLSIPLLLTSTLSTSLIIASCSNNETNTMSNTNTSQQLLSLNKQYLDNESKYISKDSQLPIFNTTKNNNLIPSFALIIENANNAINNLTNFKQQNKLNQNQEIWIDSYIYQWKNKINNIKSGMIFLGQNPLISSRPLSISSNHIRDSIKQAVNIYPINDETGDPDISKQPDPNLISTLNNRILSCNNLIKDYQNYLDFGSSTFGIQPSTISKKLLINQLLLFFFSDQIDLAASNSSKNSWNMNELLSTSPSKYFMDIINVIKSLVNENQFNKINNSINELYQTLRSFMIFYSGTYYTNQYSFAPKQTNPFNLSKTNNNEIEKTIISSNGVKLYGAGLTEDDLNRTNIGIGFMNIQTNQIPDGYLNNANQIYQQMLNNNNSINNSALEIYKLGLQLTQQGIENMKNIANQAKALIIDNLINPIDYDPDGIGPEVVRKETLTGDIFNKFNLWLNQEDFFWGREIFDTEQSLNDFINSYWSNPSDSNIQKYKQIIINQGYEEHWLNKNTINGLSSGTIKGNQALAGAVLSLKDYIDFKDSTNAIFNSNFNPIKDYVIAPYNYSIREDIGVGMEGPRGSCQFQYNCDPYYSLPKWSVSSLTNHEGKMGHHTQQEYWTEYLEGGNGANNKGPGYTFVNDAFHEGWAVFAEWFGNELEIYGSNLDNITRMPTDWLNANGLVIKYNPNDITNQTAKMKQLHNGVYYNKASGSNNSNQKLQNSIRLANMLQYYGYLNEAQLRNMRLCLDTAYHFKSTNNTNQVLPFGSSIKQVRNYMKNNSALSIGDINSESLRYLSIPSQATGYMLGKIIFQDLYLKVETKLNTKLVTNKLEIKKLFDLMLRNGEIPLEVLKQQVMKQYCIS